MHKAIKAIVFAIAFVLLFGSWTARANKFHNVGSSYTVLTADDETDTEEINARVARVSFVSGDARIKRSGSDEWESVTLNLPIVEGDEIVTESEARVELQLAKDQHLRISENSSFKMVIYSDEGVAVSLASGTLNLRLRSFDKEKSFFEVDAPKTTIAIQAPGAYRIDAGSIGASEVRIAAVTGEARIYTETSGFTLKSGRRARLFIDGPTQGEWETGDAMAVMDGFDRWANERDEVIALRLGASHYDKYYDDDIYGADDLNDHGQWIHTREYGYVWRPFSSAIQSYANWSPYRYGHWRWMPPFGWTWVNDEPWGWATYHHGRWFYHNGYWHWSPYGYYRPSRSWWRPALVAITIVRNNICWYPLGYHHVTINFNRNYHRRNNRRDDRRGRPSLPQRPGDTVAVERGTGGRIPLERIPPGGVVGVDVNEFGKRSREIRRLPREIAETVIASKTIDVPELPSRDDIRPRLGKNIAAERPVRDLTAAQARVGTVKRTGSEPLDKELRTTRILGGRSLRETPPVTVDNSRPQAPATGIFERPAPGLERPRVPKKDVFPGPVDNSVPPTGTKTPTERVIRRREPPMTREIPNAQPPTESTRPRRDPVVVRGTPRSTPPAEKPRDTAPRDKDPPKSEPAPAKESPRPERRPDSGSKKAQPIT